MLNLFVLTIDVDWAPNFAIREMSELLVREGVKATWFITHDSPAVRELLRPDSPFEVGYHPNFLPGSTQGRDEPSIMEHLRRFVPGRRIMRTHALVQSSPLLAKLTKEFDIDIDVSLFLPEASHLTPHRISCSHSVRS